MAAAGGSASSYAITYLNGGATFEGFADTSESVGNNTGGHTQDKPADSSKKTYDDHGDPTGEVNDVASDEQSTSEQAQPFGDLTIRYRDPDGAAASAGDDSVVASNRGVSALQQLGQGTLNLIPGYYMANVSRTYWQQGRYGWSVAYYAGALLRLAQ